VVAEKGCVNEEQTYSKYNDFIFFDASRVPSNVYFEPSNILASGEMAVIGYPSLGNIVGWDTKYPLERKM